MAPYPPVSRANNLRVIHSLAVSSTMLVPLSSYVSFEVGLPSPAIDDALCAHVVSPVLIQAPRPSSNLGRRSSVSWANTAWLSTPASMSSAATANRSFIVERLLVGWLPCRRSGPRLQAGHADKPTGCPRVK